MANEIQVAAQQTLGQLPAALRDKLKTGVRINEDLAGGITSGFAIVTVRGKVWRIKHQGEERPLLRQDGSPEATIDVVILRASPNIAKVFYINGYTEGSNAPPDCWSVNGIKPDPASPHLQSPTCAGCPQNAWGSASRGGRASKGKACADNKRLAIVPAGDIKNELYGGAMLTRVPPASLGEVRQYAERLNAMGYPVEAVVTRLGFDFNAEYPSLTFKEVRALTDEEYALVEQMRNDPAVDRILNTAVDHVQTDGNEQPQAIPAQGNVTPIRPQQTPQQPPAGFTPTPQQAAQAAQHGANPQTGELPQATTPAAASVQRVAEVKAAETGDPNAAKREGMRALGMTDEQINAVLGPPPKPAEPEDPRIAGLKALGLSDEQIKAALGITPAGNGPAPAAQANGAAPAQTRKRRSRAEIEADNAAKAAAQQPQQTPPSATQPVQGGGFGAQATQPLNGEVLPPQGSSDEPERSALPAGFEDQLDGLLGMQP